MISVRWDIAIRLHTLEKCWKLCVPSHVKNTIITTPQRLSLSDDRYPLFSPRLPCSLTNATHPNLFSLSLPVPFPPLLCFTCDFQCFFSRCGVRLWYLIAHLSYRLAVVNLNFCNQCLDAQPFLCPNSAYFNNWFFGGRMEDELNNQKALADPKGYGWSWKCSCISFTSLSRCW